MRLQKSRGEITNVRGNPLNRANVNRDCYASVAKCLDDRFHGDCAGSQDAHTTVIVGSYDRRLETNLGRTSVEYEIDHVT
jgi:hypothetical protein